MDRPKCSKAKRNGSRLKYFPKSHTGYFTQRQMRVASPFNQNKGISSKFTDFYNELPALRDSRISTATKEAQLLHLRLKKIK
jgi:hypothetical protein